MRDTAAAIPIGKATTSARKKPSGMRSKVIQISLKAKPSAVILISSWKIGATPGTSGERSARALPSQPSTSTSTSSAKKAAWGPQAKHGGAQARPGAVEDGVAPCQRLHGAVHQTCR